MSDAADAAALQVARAFIEAFNNRDHAGVAGTMNYPHVRLANGRFATIPSYEAFVEQSRTQVAKSLEEEGWHHTNILSMEVVHSGDDKVHLACTYERCHEDGRAYLTFDTLWIATEVDGHWGIQFRSSYLRPVAAGGTR